MTVGGNFNWAPTYLVRVSEAQTLKIPIRRVLDLYALWKFDGATQLRISGFNLLRPLSNSASTFFQDEFNEMQTTSQRNQLRWSAMVETKF